MNAATLAELQSQLEALRAKLAALQAQAAQPLATTVSSCPNLSRNLARGMRGEDVRQLQQFLIAQQVLAADSATGYFGPLTERAVQQWQSQNGIVSSGSPTTTGYGAIGPKTRTQLARCAEFSRTLSPSPLPPAPTLSLAPPPTTSPSSPPLTPASPITPESVSHSVPASCTFNGQTVPDGASVTAYQSSSVAYGASCVSEVRLCTNGALSGSFAHASCTLNFVTPQAYYSGTGSWSNAFDQALAMAAAGRLTFYLPNGTYMLDRKILVPEGVRIIGESRDSTIITFAGSDILYIATGNNGTIKKLTIDCAQVPQSSGIVVHGLENDYRHDVEISRVHVTNCAYQGISLQFARNVTVDTVETESNGARGINVSAFSHDNRLSNISAHNNAYAEVIVGHGSYNNTLEHAALSDSSNGGLWLVAGAHHNTVHDVTITSPKVGPWIYGIVLWDAYSNALQGVQIVGFKHGILARASDYDSPYASVVDDTHDNTFDGFSITGDGTAESAAVELNVLSKAANSTRQYIVLDNTFSNMTVGGVAHAATAVSQTSSESDIRGNVFERITTSALYDFGIHVSNTVR